jgi:hypothetical protein
MELAIAPLRRRDFRLFVVRLFAVLRPRLFVVVLRLPLAFLLLDALFLRLTMFFLL